MSRALAILLLFSGISWSQTTFASITGTVTDPAGAVVPNATITATNVATNIETRTLSNEAGNYTVAQLQQGTHSLTVSAAGFKQFVVQDVVLVSRDIRRVDAKLEVGAVTSTVEVSGGATLIETETARIADTTTSERMKSMPLNTRNIYGHLALSANVLQAGAGSSTIRFAGSRTNQSHWAIDGTTMSDGVTETQIGHLALYLESVQEVKIDIANNSAEFGPIGQVTMISKSGTNALHGSAFDYFSTPWFRARNPFALQRDPGVSHFPGVSVNGPVRVPKMYNGKDKSFFFFSYEANPERYTGQLLNPTVPPAPWRQGDFSNLSTIVRDPTTGQGFPGNRIPAARLNATALKIQERFYPLPNFGDPSLLVSQNYRETRRQPYKDSYWTARADHRFSANDAVFGRFTLSDAILRNWDGNLPTLGLNHYHRMTRGMTLSYSHIFKPSLINEFRYGFAYQNYPRSGAVQGKQLAQELGLQNLAPNLPDVSGILQISWAGVGLTGLSQLGYTNPGSRLFNQDFQDHLSWFRGRHNVKLGVNHTRLRWDEATADPSLFGNLTFSASFTGHPYGDFLLGIPTTMSRAFPFLRVNRVRSQYDFFVADDFKVSSKLTVNLGIRYEYHPFWRELQGYGSMFEVGSGKIVVPDGSLKLVSPIFPRGYVDVVEAKTLGLPGNTLARGDRNNVAPRIGIAYRPRGNNTVIRAGFGIFYDVVSRALTFGGLPFILNEPAYTNPAANPTVVLPRVFPSTAGGPATAAIPTAVNPDLQMPYSMQYNVTLEHTRWNTGFRLSYIGTNTRHGEWSYNYNAPIPDARPYIAKPRLFSQYPAISYISNGAGHQYHGLTAEMKRPLARGLHYTGAWTWARDIADLDRGEVSENPFDRRRERAVSIDIPTHRVTANAIYELPFGKGRPFLGGASRALNLAVGGWDLSAIYSLYSGQFLTPLWTGPDPTGTAFTASSTPANVTIRPDILRNPNLPSEQRAVNRWFDSTAFGPPGPGRFGTSAKGVIKGPGVNVWHIGVYKSFQFADKAPKVRWEMMATNFFNHPNYSNPGVNISALTAVGVISGVGGVHGTSTGDFPGARAFRTGLRVEW